MGLGIAMVIAYVPFFIWVLREWYSSSKDDRRH